MNDHGVFRASPAARPLAVAAWVVLLLASELPDIVWHHATGGNAPAWLFSAKVAMLAVFAGLSLAVRSLRPLLPFSAVFLVFYVTLGVTRAVRWTAWFQSTLNYEGASFFTSYLGVFMLDAIVALAVIGALWAAKRRRSEFFLVKGDLRAPIGPVRWLGIREGESWRAFGWIFATVAGLGVLVPTVLGLRPSAETLLQALPLLPAVVLFAAVNAFTEEVYFRAAFLSTLPQAVGRTHALLMTVALFGLAHYLAGSPPGLVGASMTGFLAYLLGKAMLETRGLLWPWFIHFVPDVVIFASYAIAFVHR